MVLIGRLLGMAETIEFHGASIDELIADFRFAVDHYLSECEKSDARQRNPLREKIAATSRTGNSCAIKRRRRSSRAEFEPVDQRVLVRALAMPQRH